MNLEFTVEIFRPPRDVFAVVGDLENDPKWQSAVIATTKLTSGPIAKGTRFRHVMKLMNRRADLDIEFVRHDPYERYVVQCNFGPLAFGTEVRFEPTSKGTRLVTLVAGRPKGVLKLAAVTLSDYRRSEIEADLINLKDLMESRAL
jgi:hypothetical protein